MRVKHKHLNRAVEEVVRSRIASGEYGVGSKIPTTTELAVETGTSVCTVQTALTRLTAEGLLNRRTRLGTFIRSDESTLTRVGIYFNSPFFTTDMGVFGALGLELQRKLTAQGVMNMIWSDDRPESDQSDPPPGLKRAIEKREIQALIAPLICESDNAWLSALPIPVAIRNHESPHKYSFFTDLEHLVRAGLGELRRQGCRTVGVISNLSLARVPVNSAALGFHRAVLETAGELGLELQNDWLRFPSATPESLGDYGYEQFHALWELARRPEGLLVYPDSAAKGVITAILEQRLDIPRELKLVFHAHDLLPYPCPLPATFLVSEVAKHADELIRLAREQFAGRDPKPLAPRVSVIRRPVPGRHSPSGTLTKATSGDSRK